MIFKEIFRPSGGLYYHLRAWRHRRLWRPFQEKIHAWLETWPCATDELLLFGPSGGYNLPTPWLKKFRKIEAFDLDPLAEWMFRRNHPDLDVHFHRVNLFWRDNRLSVSPLIEVLDRHPRASLLFCNVLGQVLLEGLAGEEEWLAFLRHLRQVLNGREWASFHDTVTTEGNEAIDHLLDGAWLDGLTQTSFEWQLTPTSRHQVTGVWESPATRRPQPEPPV